MTKDVRKDLSSGLSSGRKTRSQFLDAQAAVSMLLTRSTIRGSRFSGDVAGEVSDPFFLSDRDDQRW